MIGLSLYIIRIVLMIKTPAMTIRIYVRASTKEQDAERALSDLIQFGQNYEPEYVDYVENESGTKLNRPILGSSQKTENKAR